MDTDTLLRLAVRGAIGLGSTGALIGAGTALARTSAPDPATSPAATRLGNIIVTGTHIPLASIATAQPILTINHKQIAATGFTTVGQLLQSITSSGGAVNTQFNNGGDGSVYVNLHQLGPERVLVLVNGQRWIAQLGGGVDLSTIPLSVIDHVDILLDGAGAIYGSDAIAGVINIITVKNFNGAAARAYFGMYDGHGDGGGWDGKTQRYSFIVGTSGDRSGVLLSAGYYEQDQVWAGQRTISKEPYLQGGNALGSDSIPQGWFWLGSSSGATVPNFPGCSSQAFFGYPGCYMAGPVTGPHANPHPYTSADNFNYAPLNYLLTPSERWYIYSQGHYDLTDNLSFNFLTAYTRRNSEQFLAPPNLEFGAEGDYTSANLPVGVSATNPYNPFGVDLVPSLPTTGLTNVWCSKYGTGPNKTCSPGYLNLLYVGFRTLNTQRAQRIFQENAQTFYFNGGFNGYWQIFGNQWTWDAHYVYENTTNVEPDFNTFNFDRIQKALGPLSDCTAPCVPLDIFQGASQITPAQLNYITYNAVTVQAQTMRDYNANIGGTFFNGWYAGPWGVAAGYEYDELDGYYSPDSLSQISGSSTTMGREATNAEYVELNVPLASNLPLAKELSVDVANRWSQFKWNGSGSVLHLGPPPFITSESAEGRAHSSTGRVTLKWNPVKQLLIRGSWSQSFRIPSISELFGGVGGEFPVASDPCAPGPFGGWNGKPADLPPGCHGVPHTQTSEQILTVEGASPALQPERAITRSAGFVYSPGWAPGLNFSADYFTVKVVGIIQTATTQHILNECYLKQDAEACGHIQIIGGQISEINNVLSNNGSLKVSGWDSELDYKFPATPVGNFEADLTMDFITHNVTCSDTGDCADLAGAASSFYGGVPKHRYNLGLDWNYGPWSAAWNLYLIGPLWENCDIAPVPASGPVSPSNPLGNWCSNPHKGWVNGQPGNPLWPQGQNHLGTTVYNDVQGSYTVSAWNTTFTLGCENVFDKSPPISRTAYANSMVTSFYRIPGRFFYGKISVNF